VRPRDSHLPGIDDDADLPLGLVDRQEFLAARESDRRQRAVAPPGAPAEEVGTGEGGDEGVARVRDEVGRRPELAQAAVHEHAHLVGERRRVLVVVRHEQRRQLEPAQQLGELVPNLCLRVRVERGERLVEEEHRGVARECPRERDPLPLAARQLPRVSGGEVRDPEALEQRLDRTPGGSEGDVAAHAEMREERVVLEDEADAAMLGRQREAEGAVEPGFAVERDAAAARLGETRDDAEHRRLPRAGGPDEGDGAGHLEREL
jgi:hypothetical protein